MDLYKLKEKRDVLQLLLKCFWTFMCFCFSTLKTWTWTGFIHPQWKLCCHSSSKQQTYKPKNSKMRVFFLFCLHSLLLLILVKVLNYLIRLLYLRYQNMCHIGIECILYCDKAMFQVYFLCVLPK